MYCQPWPSASISAKIVLTDILPVVISSTHFPARQYLRDFFEEEKDGVLPMHSQQCENTKDTLTV